MTFGLIVGRLWELQIIEHEEYKFLSENNRVKTIIVTAPRGFIYDRYHRVIVGNRPSFNLTLSPEDVQDLSSILSLCQGRLGIPSEEIRRKIKFSYLEKAIILKRNLDYQQVAFIEEHRLDFPGLGFQVEPMRDYPYGSLAAHVLGYLGEIDREQLRLSRRSDTYYYQLGDLVGQCGIEGRFEVYLRGNKGKRLVEVDNLGRELRLLKREVLVPGDNLVLNIDLELQQFIEGIFRDKSGAIVILDPNTGEVLALVSHPAFDPNLFASSISPKDWMLLRNNGFKPLQNRVIQGLYPPGSVFKIITAIAALETGIVTPQTEFNCPGYLYFGGRLYHCWKGEGHGRLDLHRAIVESCNVYFYQLGSRLGIDNLAKYAAMLGLGQPTGIDLFGEKGGLIPNRAWKEKVLGERWYPGETLSASIGQGYVLVTPLQMAVMISAIANGGRLYRPLLVREIESPQGKVIKRFRPRLLARLSLKDSTLRFIREALWGVVNDKRGTGNRAKLADVEIAGKTGTAQVVGLSRQRFQQGPDRFRPHAWFVAFAPYDQPRIALSILVENGGKGGVAAAPLARKIIEFYLGRQALRDVRLSNY